LPFAIPPQPIIPTLTLSDGQIAIFEYLQKIIFEIYKSFKERFLKNLQSFSQIR